ncbi:MAG: hypothetical protein VW378_07545 [bacterium]
MSSCFLTIRVCVWGGILLLFCSALVMASPLRIEKDSIVFSDGLSIRLDGNQAIRAIRGDGGQAFATVNVTGTFFSVGHIEDFSPIVSDSFSFSSAGVEIPLASASDSYFVLGKVKNPGSSFVYVSKSGTGPVEFKSRYKPPNGSGFRSSYLFMQDVLEQGLRAPRQGGALMFAAGDGTNPPMVTFHSLRRGNEPDNFQVFAGIGLGEAPAKFPLQVSGNVRLQNVYVYASMSHVIEGNVIDLVNDISISKDSVPYSYIGSDQFPAGYDQFTVLVQVYGAIKGVDVGRDVENLGVNFRVNSIVQDSKIVTLNIPNQNFYSSDQRYPFFMLVSANVPGRLLGDMQLDFVQGAGLIVEGGRYRCEIIPSVNLGYVVPTSEVLVSFNELEVLEGSVGLPEFAAAGGKSRSVFSHGVGLKSGAAALDHNSNVVFYFRKDPLMDAVDLFLLKTPLLDGPQSVDDYKASLKQFPSFAYWNMDLVNLEATVTENRNFVSQTIDDPGQPFFGVGSGSDPFLTFTFNDGITPSMLLSSNEQLELGHLRALGDGVIIDEDRMWINYKDPVGSQLFSTSDGLTMNTGIKPNSLVVMGDMVVSGSDATAYINVDTSSLGYVVTESRLASTKFIKASAGNWTSLHDMALELPELPPGMVWDVMVIGSATLASRRASDNMDHPQEYLANVEDPNIFGTGTGTGTFSFTLYYARGENAGTDSQAITLTSGMGRTTALADYPHPFSLDQTTIPSAVDPSAGDPPQKKPFNWDNLDDDVNIKFSDYFKVQHFMSSTSDDSAYTFGAFINDHFTAYEPSRLETQDAANVSLRRAVWREYEKYFAAPYGKASVKLGLAMSGQPSPEPSSVRTFTFNGDYDSGGTARNQDPYETTLVVMQSFKGVSSGSNTFSLKWGMDRIANDNEKPLRRFSGYYSDDPNDMEPPGVPSSPPHGQSDMVVYCFVDGDSSSHFGFNLQLLAGNPSPFVRTEHVYEDELGRIGESNVMTWENEYQSRHDNLNTAKRYKRKYYYGATSTSPSWNRYARDGYYKHGNQLTLYGMYDPQNLTYNTQLRNDIGSDHTGTGGFYGYPHYASVSRFNEHDILTQFAVSTLPDEHKAEFGVGYEDATELDDDAGNPRVEYSESFEIYYSEEKVDKYDVDMGNGNIRTHAKHPIKKHSKDLYEDIQNAGVARGKNPSDQDEKYAASFFSEADGARILSETLEQNVNQKLLGNATNVEKIRSSAETFWDDDTHKTNINNFIFKHVFPNLMSGDAKKQDHGYDGAKLIIMAVPRMVTD